MLKRKFFIVLLILSLWCTVGYAQNQISSNPIAYWKLDDDSANTVLDETGNYNGVGQNTPFAKRDSILLYGFRFVNPTTSNDQYILLNTEVPAQNNSFTLCVWVYPTSIPDDDMYVFGGGIGLSLSQDLEPSLAKPSNIDQSQTITPANNSVHLNQWMHITVTYDNSTRIYNYYINGNPAGSGSWDYDFETGISYIAKANDSFGLFDGQLDDLRIYSEILSEADIKIVANHPPLAFDDSFVAKTDASLTIYPKGVLANDIDYENDTLQVQLVTNVSNGELRLNPNGSFRYNPNSEFTGDDSFTYRVDDGKADVNSATVTINVSADNNNKPVAINDSFELITNTPLLIQAPGIIGNDYDSDGDGLTAQLVETTQFGTLSLKTNGLFSYIPNEDFNSEDTFSYHINDGISDSSTASVAIVVSSDSQNHIPYAVGDFYYMSTNSTLNISKEFGIISNDFDADGDSLNCEQLTNPEFGDLTLNPDGSFEYNSGDNLGTVEFIYTVNDGTVDGNSVKVQIKVTDAGINHPPLAVYDSGYSVNLTETLQVPNVDGVLKNDYDVDGNQLTAILDTNAQYGNVILQSDGSFEYEPPNDYTGIDWFTYYVNDGIINSLPVFVKINILPQNLSPIGTNDQYTVVENQILTVDIPGVLENDSDPEGQELTAIKTTEPLQGILNFNADGSFNYTPNADYSGSDSFSYVANDGHSDSSEVTVNISISPANEPPVASGEDYHIHANDVLLVSAPGILANDSDLESSQINTNLVNDVTNGDLTFYEDGAFAYLPDLDFIGTDSFSYTVSDGELNSDEVIVQINVEADDAEIAPAVISEEYFISENTTLEIPQASGILINDLFENITNTTSVKISDTSNGTLQLQSDGSFSYSPSTDFLGLDNFTYRIDEGGTEGNTGAVKINVIENGEKLNPTAVPDTYFVTKNTTLQVATSGVLSNDFDADTDVLNADLVDDAYTGSVTLNADGSFEYEPEIDFIGTDWFSYTASDGNSTSNTVFVKIIITETPHNMPPTALDDNYSLSENTELQISYPGILSNDTDAENDIITAVNSSQPLHGALKLETNGSFSYKPDENYVGSDSFTYQAYDGSNYSNTATVNIQITQAGENNPPIAQNDSYETRFNIALEVETPGVIVNDTDPNGDNLSATVITSVSNGTLNFNSDGSFTYVPEDGFTGNDSFVYTLNDGELDSNEATVTINVKENQPPISNADTYSVLENTTLLIPANGVLTNDKDPDGDAIIVSIEQESTQGEVILNEDGSFIYIPNANFTGTDTFTYIAEDDYDYGTETTVTIQINSSEAENSPIGIEDFYFITENNTLTVSGASGILSNDISSNTLTTSLSDNVLYGNLTLNNDGSFSYTPLDNFIGDDRFTYIATDGTLNSEKITVHLNITGEDQITHPVAVFDQYYSPQGKIFFIPDSNGLLENDLYINKDNVTVNLTTDASFGFLTLNEDGSFEYEPEDDNFTGIDFFSYTVIEEDKESYPATVMIEIIPEGINNTPTANDDTYTVLANNELKISDPGVLSNDYDADNDSLQAIKVSNTIYGILNFNSDGSFSYKPSDGFTGTDSFTYYVSDSQSNSEIATVTIIVKPIGENNPPIAQNDSYSVVAGGMLSVSAPGILTNDYDPDGDNVSINLVEDVSNGELIIYPDGSFTYESYADTPEEDFFIYNLSDPDEAVSNNATVIIHATENTPPQSFDDSFFARVNEPLIVSYPGVLSNDIDVNGESLMVSLVDDIPAEAGELTLNDNGSFVYIPQEDFSGTLTFTYYAEDALNESNISTVSISVSTADNVAPTALKDQYRTNLNSMLIIPASSGVLSNDIDADRNNLITKKVTEPFHGNLTLNNDGSFVYTPEKDFVGTDSFSYQVNDGEFDSDETRVYIAVASHEPQMPMPVPDYYTLPQNTISFVPSPGVLNNDMKFDSNSMIASVDEDPYFGYLTLNENGSFEYEPEDENFTGLDWFSYYIETEKGDSHIVYVTVNIKANGEEIIPVAQNDTYYSKQDVDLVITAPGILANDYSYDPSVISLTLKSIPIRGFLTLNNDGSFTYSPSQGFIGQDKFEYLISNGSLESKNATVIINISSNGDNAPPVANTDLYTTPFNKILNIPAPGILENDFDPDGDAFVPSIVEEPYYGSITLNEDGSFEYEPEDDFSGKDWFTYSITDSSGLESQTSVIITINNNEPPEPQPDTYDLEWNTPLRVFAFEGVLANDIDNDGDELFAYVEDDVSHGYLDLNEDGSFEYEPDEDFYGDSDWFTYYVDDGTEESEPVKVTLRVAQQNITLGSLISVSTSEIDNDAMDAQFSKAPKIYGVFGSAQRAALKKLPKDQNPMPSDVAKGIWKKKYSLFYNTKDIKEYGYSGWFAWNTLKPIEVNLWVKYKTESKIPIEEAIKTIYLAPPRFEAFLDTQGNPIDLSTEGVKPGSIVTIKGKFFGDRSPKVSFEAETENESYKYIKLKVLKEPTFPNYKGTPNSSYMNIETGESLIKVAIPTKKIIPGETYPLIINNKIGVAATLDGDLPEIYIK